MTRNDSILYFFWSILLTVYNKSSERASNSDANLAPWLFHEILAIRNRSNKKINLITYLKGYSKNFLPNLSLNRMNKLHKNTLITLIKRITWIPLSTLSKINIKVNGETKEIKENQNLYCLLEYLGFNLDLKGLAIALNWEIVHREKWSLTYVQEGDLIELVKPVQGG